MREFQNSKRRAIVLFIRNERRNNYKIFHSRSTYDLLNSRLEGITAQVKNQIDVDLILCSDDPGLIEADYFIKQTGKNFGDKFNKAVNETVKLGYNELIIIGNDSPELTSQHIIDAFENIAKEKVVIGPSNDGGIYLLGFSKHNFAATIKARWNTSCVKDDLLKQFRFSNILLLDYLSDIDCESDLVIWVAAGSKIALIFQRLISSATAVQHKLRNKSLNFTTEQNLFRVHTQKAPPHLISFS